MDCTAVTTAGPPLTLPRQRVVTVLSTADFRSHVWTNKQHLASGLADRVEVRYIESMGLRQPRLNRSDVSRIGARLRRAPRAADARPQPDRLSIIRPVVIPFHASSTIRKVNYQLVRRRLLPALNGSIDVLWTFSPMTYGLVDYATTTVYHSVDLLHEQPGLPAPALLEAERRILGRAHHVIASSATIADHLKTLGREDVMLWENVAQVEQFAGKSGPRAPRAIFAGNLTPAKVDFGLLHQLVDAGVNLALAGPIGIDGSRAGREVYDLFYRPGVTYLGLLSLPDLARECRVSTVGLIPYVLDAHTRGIFPMKTYEYLAAGLPVVTTELPSFAGRSIEGVHVCDRSEFAATVAHLARSFDEAQADRRRNAAMTHSWSSRIDDALKLIGATCV